MRHQACIALAASCLSAPAIAQDQPAAGQLPSPEEVLKRDTVTVGLGAGVTPDYEGSDDYRFIPAAAIRGRVSGIAFTTRGTYLYVDVVSLNGNKVDFVAGPIAGVRLGNRRHIKDDVVELLPRLDRAIEVGGFVGASAPVRGDQFRERSEFSLPELRNGKHESSSMETDTDLLK